MLSEYHLKSLQLSPSDIGVLLIDHGSRRSESNELLFEVASLFQRQSGYAIVEPAHMELAEPSIATAFHSAVNRGAKFIVAFPYFLSPGRHWNQDVPNLVASAAKDHPEIRYMVTSPLGTHPLMMKIIEDRVEQCMSHNFGQVEGCDMCEGHGNCLIRRGN